MYRIVLALCFVCPIFAQKVDFRRDVQPIFKESCYGCHGPTLQRNGFRLDRRSAAFRGGTIAVIARGSSDASRMYHRLTGNQYGPQMPPTGALPEGKIKIIKDWLDQGAEWPDDAAGETPLPPPDPKATALMNLLRTGDSAGFRKALAADPKSANRRGTFGATPLMYAVLYSDAATVRLLLDAGADPNLGNDGGATALMWAVRDPEKARLLIDHGANVNARSDAGRTPLLIASGIPGPPIVLNMLLEHGADPNAHSPGLVGDMTPLAEAAGTANDGFVQLLLEHGAKVDPKDPIPLFLSMATHCDKCAEPFIKAAGPAMVNPAMAFLSPPFGDGGAAKRMLELGADANGRDLIGNPILTLVAAAETMPLDDVKALITHGADLQARNPDGLTALDVARRHGRTAMVELLENAGAKSGVSQPGGPKPSPAGSPRAAVARTLPLLQQNDAVFRQKSGCVSCHNNTLTSMTIAAARKRGLAIDQSEAADQLKYIGEYLGSWRERVLQNVGIPGDVDTVGAILMGLAAMNYPPDANTDAMAIYIRAQQLPNGMFHPLAHRPPLEVTPAMTTLSAIRALQVYAPKPQRADFAKAVQLAAAWMAKTEPAGVQDLASQLLGLTWADGDKAVIRKSAAQLRQLQREDGGWSQIPTLQSDAFATGQALTALIESGTATTADAAYQKGIKFLLSTQAADGSWFVATRVMPIQPYFETGFPYGHDQWISTAATNWAAMALIPAAK